MEDARWLLLVKGVKGQEALHVFSNFERVLVFEVLIFEVLGLRS